MILPLWWAWACAPSDKPTDHPGNHGPVDADGDHIDSTSDCDDADPSVGLPIAWYEDIDRDGWGVRPAGFVQCVAPLYDYTSVPGDCDDRNAYVYPGRPEICNNRDDDCDGRLNEDLPDLDADGYSECGGDCNDADPAVNPLATELWYDGIDQDCDEWPDDDADHDGIDVANDCDDTDGRRGEPAFWYKDADGDQFGTDMLPLLRCVGPPGYVRWGEDCDDADPGVNPDAVDVCEDGLDQDCDGNADCGLWGDLSPEDAVATLYGEAEGDYTGSSGGVAGLGDVNGDGVVDIAVGSPWSDAGGYGSGAVYVVLGPIQGESNLSEASARWVHDSGGRAGRVAAAGDVDGDGVPDLLVGAYMDQENGRTGGAAYIVPTHVTGQQSLADATAKRYGEAEGNGAGIALAGAGDVNEDGFDDVLVGAPLPLKLDDPLRGATYLLHGPLSGTASLATADLRIGGTTGGSLAGGRDLDGDGTPDVLVGAPFYDPARTGTGAVFMVSGALTGSVDLSALATRLLGQNAWDLAGSAVASLGDTDDDGYNDIAVGAPAADTPNPYSGCVYLVRGPIGDQRSLGEADGFIVGHMESEAVGDGVAAAGDTDGDGRSDLLLRGSGGAAEWAGEVFVFYGPVAGTWSVEDAGASLLGRSERDFMGSGLASAGDTDADGFDDILVGAPGFEGSNPALLLRGGPGP